MKKYRACRIGSYHDEYQDNCTSLKFGDYYISSIADGLGSCRYSAEASKLATENIVKLVKKELSAGNTEKCIENAYNQLFSLMIEKGFDDDEHHTTLTTIVFTNKSISIGHVGDSAVIIKEDGAYKKITESMNPGGIKCVVTPFLEKEKWEFSKYNLTGELEGVLLTTDGLMEAFEPQQGKLFVELLDEFMNSKRKNMPEKKLNAIFEHYLNDEMFKVLHDDLTVLTYLL